LHTLHLDKVSLRQKRFENHNAGKGFRLEALDQETKNEYSIHKECSVVGVDIARRPKHHLIAAVLYYVNFWLRRIDRKTELFDDVARQYQADKDPEAVRQAELIYD